MVIIYPQKLEQKGVGEGGQTGGRKGSTRTLGSAWGRGWGGLASYDLGTGGGVPFSWNFTLR